METTVVNEQSKEHPFTYALVLSVMLFEPMMKYTANIRFNIQADPKFRWTRILFRKCTILWYLYIMVDIDLLCKYHINPSTSYEGIIIQWNLFNIRHAEENLLELICDNV